MWDFSHHTSREQVFNGLSWSFWKAAGAGSGAGAGVGAWASRTALKIRSKLSLEYFKISIVAAGAKTTEDFVPKGLAGYLENSDLKDGKESGGATEGAIERRSQRG